MNWTTYSYQVHLHGWLRQRRRGDTAFLLFSNIGYVQLHHWFVSQQRTSEHVCLSANSNKKQRQAKWMEISWCTPLRYFLLFFPFGILILSFSTAGFIIQNVDTVVHCALTAIHYIAWRKVMPGNNEGILPDELIMMITSREGDLNAILNCMRTLENFWLVSFT